MPHQPQFPSSFTPRRRWVVGFDMIVRTLLVLAVIAMVNYLSSKFFHREYLSAQTRTDLSPRTLNLVRSVTNDVKVVIYYNREDDLFSSIATMLREYQALNPRIRVEVVDYLRDAAEAQKIKLEYKLPEAQKDTEKNFIIFDAGNGNSKVVSGELLADREFVVDEKKGTYDRPIRAFKGELFFTGMLIAVTNPKPLKAYVLQGHGEHNFASGDEVSGYLDFNSVLAHSMIKAEPLSLLQTNTVPQDCDLLIVAGPQTAMSDDELEKIDKYLNAGGRLFALFNVGSIEHPSGLERILRRWNVIVSFTCVQDKNSLNTLRSAPGADVIIGRVNNKHPVTKDIYGYNLDLIYPRPVVPVAADKDPDAPKVIPLFETEATATIVGNPKIKPSSYTLAVAVERPPAPGVAARGATRMVVVGDSLFLANGPIKIAANRNFADAAVNWLVERSHLADGIGPKAMSDYRITLSGPQMKTIQWLLLAALPGGILLFGGLVWLRRLK